MDENELRKCLHIHNYYDSEEENDSESSTKLDEKYEAFKPKPIQIDPKRHKIIEIGGNQQHENFTEALTKRQKRRKRRKRNENTENASDSGKIQFGDNLSKNNISEYENFGSVFTDSQNFEEKENRVDQTEYQRAKEKAPKVVLSKSQKKRIRRKKNNNTAFIDKNFSKITEKPVMDDKVQQIRDQCEQQSSIITNFNGQHQNQIFTLFGNVDLSLSAKENLVKTSCNAKKTYAEILKTDFQRKVLETKVEKKSKIRNKKFKKRVSKKLSWTTI